MKYNIEHMSQKDIVFNSVVWFPNFWVRKFLLPKINGLIIVVFRAQM
jgi:hypothetical protein